MPTKIINWVTNLGTRQKMPSTLMFGNQHACLIPDTLDQFTNDASASHNSDFDPANASSVFNNNNVINPNNYVPDLPSTSVANNPSVMSPLNHVENDSTGVGLNDHATADLFSVQLNARLSFGFESKIIFDNANNKPSNEASASYAPPLVDNETTGVGDNDTSREIKGVDNVNSDNDGMPAGVAQEPAQVITPATEPANNQLNQESVAQDKTTKYNKFVDAIRTGRQAGADDIQLPKHLRKKTTPGKAMLSFLQSADIDTILSIFGASNEEIIFNFVTAQMNATKGIKNFGERGSEAIMKELEQLLYQKVMEGRKTGTLTTEQKKQAPKYLMFLKEKQSGQIKGRGCTNRRKQGMYKTKEETSSSTETTESVFLTCVIDAAEQHDVATSDIPGAFMQTDINKLLPVKLEGDVAMLLIRLDPTYCQFLTHKRGRPVIYAKLSKALYGILQAALLFWKDLSSFLRHKLDFIANSYNKCVVNKEINDN